MQARNSRANSAPATSRPLRRGRGRSDPDVLAGQEQTVLDQVQPVQRGRRPHRRTRAAWTG